MTSPKTFRLFRGDECLGTVTVKSLECPWTIGAFSPEPAYENLRESFQQAWDLSAECDWDRCDPILAELEKPGLTLWDIKTNEVRRILGFHCNGIEFNWLEDTDDSDESQSGASPDG